MTHMLKMQTQHGPRATHLGVIVPSRGNKVLDNGDLPTSCVNQDADCEPDLISQHRLNDGGTAATQHHLLRPIKYLQAHIPGG